MFYLVSIFFKKKPLSFSRYKYLYVLAQLLSFNVDFSMTAGDFLDIYAKENQQSAWDVVATCFFIDTASNFLDYLDVITQVLKPGGIWINMGPLLYHFEGDSNKVSFELPLNQIFKLVEENGFQFLKTDTLQATYASQPTHMLQHVYNCSFWVAQKRNI